MPAAADAWLLLVVAYAAAALLIPAGRWRERICRPFEAALILPVSFLSGYGVLALSDALMQGADFRAGGLQVLLGLAGVIGLWVALLCPGAVYARRPRLAYAVGAALLAGAGLALATLGFSVDRYGMLETLWHATTPPIVLPLLVGLRHLGLIVRARRSAV